MATMRTIPKAYKEIKEKDPNACISLAALRKWVKDGTIPSVKVGNHTLICMENLYAFLGGGSNGNS